MKAHTLFLLLSVLYVGLRPTYDFFWPKGHAEVAVEYCAFPSRECYNIVQEDSIFMTELRMGEVVNWEETSGDSVYIWRDECISLEIKLSLDEFYWMFIKIQ